MLANGAVLAIPTETFYGLAVDPFNAEAVRRVQTLKGTPHGSPILLLLSAAPQVSQVAESVPSYFSTLAERFWPGPLTIVVPVAPHVPPEVAGGTRGVGVRVSGLPLARLLAEAFGKPLTGTSANVHGMPPCRTAREVLDSFASGIDLVLDAGPTPGGLPSTVLDLTGPRAAIVREGAVPLASLRPFISL
jgi:L-threonylcarbamoyladenylate synthase